MTDRRGDGVGEPEKNRPERTLPPLEPA
jgi:hypothetical protein